jgi:hypothetical protein
VVVTAPLGSPSENRYGAARVVIAILGLYNLFAASRLVFVEDGGALQSQLWPWWFAAAGLATMWLATGLASERALIVSGVLNVIAYTGRSLVLLANGLEGRSTLTDERVQLGVITWLVLALVVAYLWIRVFRPLVQYRQRILKGR